MFVKFIIQWVTGEEAQQPEGLGDLVANMAIDFAFWAIILYLIFRTQ